MRHTIVLLLLLASFSFSIQAQNLVLGEWRSHFSHNRAIESTEKNGWIYTLTTGGLVTYDRINGEQYTYSTVDGLSGVGANTIYHDRITGRIFIGYSDGRIDHFTSLDNIGTYTQIFQNTVYLNKSINAFASSGDTLYVATDFGLVVYDMESGLPITDVIQIGNNPSRLPITDVTTYQNRLWLLVESAGMYSVPLNTPNLKDPSNWSDAIEADSLPAELDVMEIGGNANALYLLTDQGLYKYQGEEWIPEPKIEGDFWTNLSVMPDAVAVSQGINLAILNRQNILYRLSLQANVEHIWVAGDAEFYYSTIFRGIIQFKDWENTSLIPNGPQNNDAIRLAVSDKDIYIAPRGYDQLYAPVPTGGGLYYQNFEKGIWENLNAGNDRMPEDFTTSFVRAIYNPTDGKTYVGSFSEGMGIMSDGALESYYNCSNSGMPVVSVCDPESFGISRVSGIDFDRQGNIWLTVAVSNHSLSAITPDGEWVYVPDAVISPGIRVVDLLVDDFGNKWMIEHENGLMVYTDNGTPDILDDGRLVRLRSGLNNGGLETNDVFCFAKDLDGFIWVGTGQGVGVYYDLGSISQGRIVDAAPPVYEQRELLKNASIFSIAVDGGNRKWLGTDEGAYLVSPTGDDVIKHFTTQNSPLPDETVVDIEINGATGEVFFATSKGVVSYQGDATTGSAVCDEVLVYPNPYFTDSENDVVIQGSAAGSMVRITTASGRLVREIQAEGGTTVWNGRDLDGQKVASGVYLVLMADENGENPCLGKFVVIDR
ncbi:T9SS type A sorting domain-containing protein [Pontibacter sp. G13]|uniref:type IX secretion system anionic LPS delivery protein PorZ n=1 Tax=Pontibacter sp. G13 TaxID=3074898 RepID=UPI00288A69C4|nr:T9SS type A sorting domain-containing protein [Pontibacter sp. G13]WNJ21437.1 T9SS type A sorting domain-containing protein [Pontibacter sp. G13]